MSNKDGGAAFPVEYCSIPEGEDFGQRGMSLRDWFAGQIAPSVILSAAMARVDCPKPTEIAKAAYATADALLAERSKGTDA